MRVYRVLCIITSNSNVSTKVDVVFNCVVVGSVTEVDDDEGVEQGVLQN